MSFYRTLKAAIWPGITPADPQTETDLNDELSFHIDSTVTELVEAGMSEREARTEAVRRFGDIGVVKHQCRTIAMGDTIMRYRIAMLALAAAVLACLPIFCMMAFADEWARISPFEGVRWTDAADSPRPLVLVNGQWYELIAIDGASTGKVLEHCRRTYDEDAIKRFTEDIYDVLVGMGFDDPSRVTLTLRAPDGGRITTLPDVRMTTEKRQSIMHGRFTLSREAMLDDLAYLQAALEDQFSYLHLKGIDHQTAFMQLAGRLPVKMENNAFALELEALLAPFGDGHASASGAEPPEECLPLLIGDTGDHLVAFHPDRSGLIDAQHPYLAAIDGVPVERWLEAASRGVAHGSPQLIRHRAIRNLRHWEYLRGELGLEPAATARLTLESADGRQQRVLELSPTSDKPIYGDWPRATMDARVLEGNVGYLRIASMRDDLARRIPQAMAELRGTGALIIDVRGNGGGSRSVLRALFPYFMPPDAEPYVASVAAYRLSRHFKDDHLAARFMYRADDERWTPQQRSAIARFAATFTPQWQPPLDQFSDWHYFVLDRSLQPEAFHYDRPVAVLMNTACFSATDIFLGAFKGRPNVSLIGTPSGGGSGYTQSIDLLNSSLSLSVSSMASFGPNGRLYDTNGIHPDIAVHPQPTDFIGKTDHQLDAAIRHLRNRQQSR